MFKLRVWGLRSMVYCLGFWGLGFGVVWGSGFRVQGSGFRVQGSGFRAQGSAFRVYGSGFRVQGLVVCLDCRVWVVRLSYEIEGLNVQYRV